MDPIGGKTHGKKLQQLQASDKSVVSSSSSSSPQSAPPYQQHDVWIVYIYMCVFILYHCIILYLYMSIYICVCAVCYLFILFLSFWSGRGVQTKHASRVIIVIIPWEVNEEKHFQLKSIETFLGFWHLNLSMRPNPIFRYQDQQVTVVGQWRWGALNKRKTGRVTWLIGNFEWIWSDGNIMRIYVYIYI